MSAKTMKFPYQDTLFSYASSLVDLVKTDEVENILIAGRLKNGEVFTGRFDVSHAEMMTLIGYLQAEAIRRCEEEVEE